MQVNILAVTSSMRILLAVSTMAGRTPNSECAESLMLIAARPPSLSYSCHVLLMASNMFHRRALSLSVSVLRCHAVAMATAPNPRPEPTLAARSWSLAVARATAFAVALSFGVVAWGRPGESGVLWKLEKLRRREDRLPKGWGSPLNLECEDSTAPTPAAAIARAIAAGGDAKAAAQAGVIIAKAA